MLKKLMVLPVLVAFLSACGQGNSVPANSEAFGAASDARNIASQISEIIITDVAGNPVPGATVMIGTAPNQPFANNIIKTGSAGTFKPMRDWKTALPLTISANGYVRTTYMNQMPLQKSFMIRAKAPAVQPELNGVTTGFGKLEKDGFVDVGIVIPALARTDLANFQASSLLSPENDLIEVVGQKAYLPSNITLPQQSETIFPVNVKLNKPSYRMFFDRKDRFKVVSAHVRFPLKKIVQESQNGKTGIELVNHFTFLQTGINNTFIASDKQSLDLPVNQLPFNSTITAQAPLTRANQTVLAVALVKNNSELYPTDIKNLQSKESRSLSYPANASGFVLGVLRNDSRASIGAEIDFMSMNLKSTNLSGPLDFLPLVEEPKVSAGLLTLRPPSIPSDLEEIATAATLSTVELKTVGKNSYEIKKPEWDIYAPSWVNEIELPTLPAQTQAGRKMRWETVFMAAPEASSSNLGPELMNSVTHLTRSAVDL